MGRAFDHIRAEMSFGRDANGQMVLQRSAKISEATGQPSQRMDCALHVIHTAFEQSPVLFACFNKYMCPRLEESRILYLDAS